MSRRHARHVGPFLGVLRDLGRPSHRRQRRARHDLRACSVVLLHDARERSGSRATVSRRAVATRPGRAAGGACYRAATSPSARGRATDPRPGRGATDSAQTRGRAYTATRACSRAYAGAWEADCAGRAAGARAAAGDDTTWHLASSACGRRAPCHQSRCTASGYATASTAYGGLLRRIGLRRTRRTSDHESAERVEFEAGRAGSDRGSHGHGMALRHDALPRLAGVLALGRSHVAVQPYARRLTTRRAACTVANCGT